jgi:adenylate kinase family enzyme
MNKHVVHSTMHGLIAFIGLPGTGKTTLSKKFASRTGYIRHSSDELIAEWEAAIKRGESLDCEDASQRACRDLVRGPVIIDSVCSKQYQRMRLYEETQAGAIVLLECTAPEEIVRERLIRRTLLTYGIPDIRPYDLHKPWEPVTQELQNHPLSYFLVDTHVNTFSRRHAHPNHEGLLDVIQENLARIGVCGLD